MKMIILLKTFNLENIVNKTKIKKKIMKKLKGFKKMTLKMNHKN